MRAVAEAKRLKELGAVIIGVDASPEVRYERIVGRGSETDNVSFAEWLEQEKKESNPDDPNKQDIFGTLRESDSIVENSGTLEELHTKIDEIISRK